MITGELKNKVDKIWDTLWTAGVTSPITVLEQITYLLFMKLLDDNQTRQEANAAAWGRPVQNPVFKDGLCVVSDTPRVEIEYAKLRWKNFHDLAPDEMLRVVSGYVFPFIKSKRVEYVAEKLPPPREILAEIGRLENEIQTGLKELEGMLQ